MYNNTGKAMGAGAIPVTVKKKEAKHPQRKHKLAVFLAGKDYRGDVAVDVSFTNGVHFLTPPRELMLDYRLGRCSRAEFEQGYLRFLEQSLAENSHNWETILDSRELVLLCSCPVEDQTCHRYILIKFLKRLGAVFKGVKH